MPAGQALPPCRPPCFQFGPQMNILHVISQHPASTGSGVYLQNLLRQASAAGHRNLLVAGVAGAGPAVLDGIDASRCRFVTFAGGDLDFVIPGMSDVMPYASSRFSELHAEDILRYEAVFAEKIGGLAERFAIDVIHSHHLWLVSAVARRTLPEVPMVTSCHSTDLRQFVTCRHLRKRVREGCRTIDRVLALSPQQAEQIVDLYGIDPSRIELIGSGFDDRLFTFCEKNLRGPVQLLYAGKLSYAKGVDWLLRVCAGFPADVVHLHLVGAGSGDEERHCLELADQLGEKATVHGELSQRQLAELMRACHVFILPSFYEGLPLVLLEALATGCRIVSTDLPGCRELLAGASADLAAFVELPVLQAIDRPAPGDWQKLDAVLRDAVRDMVARVVESPTPSLPEISSITGKAKWELVFSRIEQAYGRALRGRQN